MELLKKIQIEGALLGDYAVLSMIFTFQNESAFPARGRYSFSLPEQAEISGMKMVLDGHILTAKAIPLREAEVKDGREILLHRDGERDYTLLTQGLSPARVCQIVIDLCCPLGTQQEHLRLSLPLGGRPAGAVLDAPAPEAEISLYLLGDSWQYIYSPSHPELDFPISDKLSVTLPADRDFVLGLTRQSRCNIAYTGGNMLGKTGIFFLTAPALGTPGGTRPTLFLMNLAGCTSVRCAQAKNIVYLVSRELGEGSAFSVMSTGNTGMYRGFEAVSADSGQELAFAEFLKKLPNDGNGLEDLLLRFAQYQETHRIQGVFVTAKDFPAWAIDRLTGIARETELRFLTFGDQSDFPRLREFAKNHGACITHIYPRDNMMASVRQFAREIRTQKLHQISVKATDGAGTLLPRMIPAASAGEQLCFAGVFGDAVPASFLLTALEGEAHIQLDRIEGYDSFRFAEVFYAHQAGQEVKRLMENASPASRQKLKQKLEQIGVHYNCLNTETVLHLEDEYGVPYALSAAIPVYGCPPFTAGGMGIFGEKRPGQKTGDRTLVSHGLRVLLSHLHGDGSICSPGLTGRERRNTETLLAAAAAACHLSRADGMEPVLRCAMEYLKKVRFDHPVYRQTLDALLDADFARAQQILCTTLRDYNTLLQEAVRTSAVYDIAAWLLRA